MSGAAGQDPYLDPGSGVLRNLLGITTTWELEQAEAALTASRLVDLERPSGTRPPRQTWATTPRW